MILSSLEAPQISPKVPARRTTTNGSWMNQNSIGLILLNNVAAFGLSFASGTCWIVIMSQ